MGLFPARNWTRIDLVSYLHWLSINHHCSNSNDVLAFATPGCSHYCLGILTILLRGGKDFSILFLRPYGNTLVWHLYYNIMKRSDRQIPRLMSIRIQTLLFLWRTLPGNRCCPKNSFLKWYPLQSSCIHLKSPKFPFSTLFL